VDGRSGPVSERAELRQKRFIWSKKFVWFVWLEKPAQMIGNSESVKRNKQNKPDKPNKPILL
jgi:hypothetical protein